MQVLICGAGHVAEAIVRCLLPIGVRVKWIDPRDDIFPSDLLEQAYCITTDTLDAEIEHFDRSGAVLILTHDHQLDLQLCFTALKPTAKPFAYVGMIGSKSKRAILKTYAGARLYFGNITTFGLPDRDRRDFIETTCNDCHCSSCSIITGI